MDGGVSAAWTVVDVVKLAWEVIGYIKEVKGADEERRKLALELTRAAGLLNTVGNIVEEVKDDNWARAIRALEGPAGALVAFKDLLEEVQRDMGFEVDPKQVVQPSERPIILFRSKKITKLLQPRSSSNTTPWVAAVDRGDRVWEAAVRVGSIVKDLKWPFTRPLLEALLQRLESIKMHFLAALSGDNVRLSKMIRDELRAVHVGVLAVHGDVSVIKNDTAAIREHQDGTKLLTAEARLIHQSISALDAALDAADEMLQEEKKIIQKSASWVLQHTELDEWLNDGKTLLLTGGPGHGKTIICRAVESFLRSSYANDNQNVFMDNNGTVVKNKKENVFVVAIYCSARNKPQDHSLQSVLAFIVHSMMAAHSPFHKYYNKLMLTGESPLEVADSLRFIHRARQDFDHFFVLLDGLDECNSQQAQELVDRLTSLHVPLPLFVASRPSAIVRGCSFHHYIRLEEAPTADLIRNYVRSRLDNEVREGTVRKDKAMLNRAALIISKNANGIFSWAKIIVDDLRDAKTPEDFSKTLERIETAASEQMTNPADSATGP